MADPDVNPTAATFVDASTFEITGNCLAECHTGRRIRAKLGDTERAHCTILSSTYNGTKTTITLTEGSDNLTSALSGVWVGIISGPGGYSSLPVHPHADDNSGGATLEGELTGDISGGDWS